MKVSTIRSIGAAVALAAMNASAYVLLTDDNGVRWPCDYVNQSAKTVELTWYKYLADYTFEPSGDVVVPSVIDGYTVVGIGYDTFSGVTTMKSLTLPDTVTYIRDNAFDGCPLDSLTIPGSVTSIGTIYSNARIKKIIFQHGITTIKDSFMWQNKTLESVVIPNSVTSIGDHAFYYCTALKSINIPSSVSNIGQNAFYGTALKSVTIPGNAEKGTVIGQSAFASCSALESVTLGKYVTKIGASIFSEDAALKTLVVEGQDTEFSDYTCFLRCTSLESLVIPTAWAIAELKSYTFSSSSKSLKYIRLGDVDYEELAKEVNTHEVESEEDLINLLELSGDNLPLTIKPSENLSLADIKEKLGDDGLALVVEKDDGTYEIIEKTWTGSGTADDPYVVGAAEELNQVFALAGETEIHARLAAGAAVTGTVVIPATVQVAEIDLNGGTITGTAGGADSPWGQPAVWAKGGGTAVSVTGSGTLAGGADQSGDGSATGGLAVAGGAEKTTLAGGVSVTERAAAGGGATEPKAPLFDSALESVVTRFAKVADGGNTWRIKSFTELVEGDASGVTEGMVKVYRADTVAGLKTATALTGGYTLNAKTNAVMVEVSVEAPADAPQQFFRVELGEAE